MKDTKSVKIGERFNGLVITMPQILPAIARHCPGDQTATKSDCSLTKNPRQTGMVIQVKLQDTISKKRSCPNL